MLVMSLRKGAGQHAAQRAAQAAEVAVARYAKEMEAKAAIEAEAAAEDSLRAAAGGGGGGGGGAGSAATSAKSLGLVEVLDAAHGASDDDVSGALSSAFRAVWAKLRIEGGESGGGCAPPDGCAWLSTRAVRGSSPLPFSPSM